MVYTSQGGRFVTAGGPGHTGSRLNSYTYIQVFCVLLTACSSSIVRRVGR